MLITDAREASIAEPQDKRFSCNRHLLSLVFIIETLKKIFI